MNWLAIFRFRPQKLPPMLVTLLMENDVMMTTTLTIRLAQSDDWERIKQIYLEGIATKLATFESVCSVPDAGATWFNGKIESSVFIAVENDQVMGWSALSPVSDRCVYGGVAEVSVYVATSAAGRGIGKMLLDQLIDFAEENNIWTLQAGIFSDNRASIRLHEKGNFRLVGTREKLGKLDGEWKDVVLMERRSRTIL